MRKLLLLSILAILTVSATGCTSGSSCCNEGWRPGSYLFGNRRERTQCCDPCMSGPAMMSESCCQ